MYKIIVTTFIRPVIFEAFPKKMGRKYRLYIEKIIFNIIERVIMICAHKQLYIRTLSMLATQNAALFFRSRGAPRQSIQEAKDAL
jgi:hypothetical protein